MLTMIYANGDGVARDDARAIAYACRAGGAPAEIDGRIQHLLDRRKDGVAVKTRFDFCDDITSGLMQGACAQRASRRTNLDRDKALDDLATTLNPRQAVAYATLRHAASAYATAVGEQETDLSGTGRAAFEIEAEDSEKQKFFETLMGVLAGKAMDGSSIAAADASLNDTYQRVEAQIEDSAYGTVTKAGIKSTEKAWLVYRDRFVAFAKLAAPRVSSDALTALLSKQRTGNLENFLADADR